MTADNVNIGVRVRTVIAEKGISQTELGRKLGKSPIYITRLLKRKTIDTTTLNSLCMATGYNFFMDFSLGNENREKFNLTHPHVGNLISAKLKEDKVMQVELGDYLGVSHQEVSRLLKNNSIDTGKLVLISNFLKYNFFSDFYRYTTSDREKTICPFIEFLTASVIETGFSNDYIRSVIRDYLNEVETK